MIDYYMELINKPKYMLSTSEQLFVDVFPLIIITLIAIIFIVIGCVIEAIKKK